jgi:hypothetical protein
VSVQLIAVSHVITSNGIVYSPLIRFVLGDVSIRFLITTTLAQCQGRMHSGEACSPGLTGAGSFSPKGGEAPALSSCIPASHNNQWHFNMGRIKFVILRADFTKKLIFPLLLWAVR